MHSPVLLAQGVEVGLQLNTLQGRHEWVVRGFAKRKKLGGQLVQVPVRELHVAQLFVLQGVHCPSTAGK